MTNKAPFRADHVGSLLRHQELKIARQQHELGKIDDHKLSAAEDEYTREVVAEQEAL